MLILVCDAFDPSLPARLARFGEVTTDLDRLPDAEVALVRSKTRADAGWLARAPRLRLLIRGGVGLDNVDQIAAKARGVEVRNTPEASTIAVAELAFAFLLALPNHVPVADRSIREGKWLKKELERSELAGKTLGIVGVGRIGAALARRARAFEMRVLGWRRTVRGDEPAEMVGLEELLAASDYVSLHLPLAPETHGFVDGARLARFRAGARLVNAGRGELVVEADVAAALRSGRLGGYAADVFCEEPPVGSPLLDAPNTIFAPHLGASSRENLLRIGTEIERILETDERRR